MFHSILEKAKNHQRITEDECLLLYENQINLTSLGDCAKSLRCEKTDPQIVTYLVDRNINYTNVCDTACKFCAFYRPLGDRESYVLTREELRHKIEELSAIGGTRILMQGGHHPDLKLSWYCDLLKWIQENFPQIEQDCFSPSEIDNLCKIEKKDSLYILRTLQDSGLHGLPGGGAEILDDNIRSVVSPKKIPASRWLEIMKTAQSIGLKTSASMVIGLGENFENRVEHLCCLRKLQDFSLQNYNNGFTAFIAWTLQHEYTALGRQSKNANKLGATVSEYLRNLAISRIYLDNFTHFQASWPTMGLEVAQLALEFGADDFGSTMMEENVVSQAGTKTRISTLIAEIHHFIQRAGYTPKQRDTGYRIL